MNPPVNHNQTNNQAIKNKPNTRDKESINQLYSASQSNNQSMIQTVNQSTSHANKQNRNK